MKRFIHFFLVLALTLPIMTAYAKAPEILIDSKLSYDWTEFLIHRIRKLLRNNGSPDPFTMKITEPIVVTDSTIEQYLDADAKDLLNNLGELVGLNLLKGKTKVVLHGIDYDIKDFKTNLRASEKHADGLSIDLDFAASKINLRADKVTLSIILPSKDPSKSASIDIQLIRPVIRASGKNLIQFFAKVRVQDEKDNIKIRIPDANFDKLADELIANPKAIFMNFRDIEIPDVAIRIGTKRLAFDEEKIKKLLNDRQQAIKSLLVAQLASTLKSGMLANMLKDIEEFKIKKDIWIDSKVVTQFRIDKFTTDLSRNNLEIRIPGDFCAPEPYKKLAKECVNQKMTHPMPSRINEKSEQASRDEMRSMIDSGYAHAIASISEDYVNKLLVATYDAGLWESMLKDNGVVLGPDKMKLVMNEKSDKATLIMDMTNRLDTFKGIIIGARTIRFPLVMKASVRIENIQGIPNLIVRVHEIDTSDETLKKGIPEFGAVSNIQKLRLRKMIMKEIRAKVKDLPNQDVLTLAYPELRGLGLEGVEFKADGLGRMNAILDLGNPKP